MAARRGRFPEGSALDRVDKWLSMPLFTLEPGVAVETLWSVPAWWFGNPFFALGTVPLILAAFVDAAAPSASLARSELPSSSPPWFAMIAALSLFISLTFWLNYLALMRREPDTYPFRYVYSLGLHSKGLILSFVGLIHVVSALTKLGCETTRAHEVVNFYAACYFICMAICGLLKTFVGRERPCAAGS